ncbi:hypothetical protein HYH03_016115 [Edaphochlamys debaryana]|uniref:AP2/ERF domain-containing protein n=1 Tax=Edaphochlamys debaryana TaxID=47281 RepID=A0A836BRY2_9CHLO|nr:hypothetical protein HYH03_016115 [Edaphochlamys debaryana]|eukprot:KAG2485128.1 hypothetical protein HYH03_016115 [Edaphochlamys debaryana]
MDLDGGGPAAPLPSRRTRVIRRTQTAAAAVTTGEAAVAVAAAPNTPNKRSREKKPLNPLAAVVARATAAAASSGGASVDGDGDADGGGGGEDPMAAVLKHELAHTKPQPQSRNKNGGTSGFKGVTKHRWTGKWEAHLWDPSVQRKKTSPGGRTRGKQVYLGGYGTEVEAARAYDRAALVYWGLAAPTNFPATEYADDLTRLSQPAAPYSATPTALGASSVPLNAER